MKEKSERNKFVAIDEASKALQSVSRRLGLMHLSYAKTIIEEFGEEKGIEVISKAIKDYAVKIGEKTKEEVLMKGLEPTPENFSKGESYAIPAFPGLHDRLETVEVEGVERIRAYGCSLAKIWKQYGEEKLGRLYCYMDPGKLMAYNPNYKFVHIKAIPDGHEFCELEVKHTTEEERRDFFTEDHDWFYIDR